MCTAAGSPRAAQHKSVLVMSATEFAEFLGDKLNDLRSRVVAEYCANVNNLEREASDLRSENGHLREQLKLNALHLPIQALAKDVASVQEESNSEQQIQHSQAVDNNGCTQLAEVLPEDPEAASTCKGSTLSASSFQPVGSNLSSSSFPPLEPLAEGEEHQESGRMSRIAESSDEIDPAKQKQVLLNKEGKDVEQTSLDLPLVLVPKESPQKDPKSPRSPARRAQSEEFLVKVPLHSPALPLPNAGVFHIKSNGSGARQSVASVMKTALTNAAHPKAQPQINGGHSPIGHSPGHSPIGHSPVGHSPVGIAGQNSQICTFPAPSRTSALSVPGQQLFGARAASPVQTLEARQEAKTKAAMTDVLEELETGHQPSKPPSPSQSYRDMNEVAAEVLAGSTNFLHFNFGEIRSGSVRGSVASARTSKVATAVNSYSTGQGSNENLEDCDGPEFVFDVWPIWQTKKDFGLTRKGGGETSNMEEILAAEEDEDSDGEGEENAEKSKWALLNLWSRIIVHPSSPLRLLWDCLGVLCISYEFVMLPLQFLSLSQSPFLVGAAWAMRIYWTCDFPLSFITGFARADGNIEKRPGKVAKNYIFTWMPFDICVLATDWMETVLGGVDGLGAARAGKAFKALRLLRMLRLIRLVRLRRMPEFMRVIAYKFQGERFVIVFGIIRIMIFLIGINHFIACCWYGIGDSDADVPACDMIGGSTNDCETQTKDVMASRGWVYKYEYDRAELGYRYVTSFHWSLTQFTGSADVYPQNVGERTFAVVSLLFGFLLSASVVSSITSSMTRLQIVTARQSTQVSMLKQYLFDNGISTKVALRVQRNAMYTLQQATKNTPESSIELLALVSEPLRMDLHYEIHRPTLCQHPFFRCYDEVNSPAMKKICHTCVSQLQLSRGDVLFSSGEIPPSPCTYFCINGKLQYLQEYGYRNGARRMDAGQWSCEAVLWTAWVHIGMLRAKTECSLQLLSAGNFQSIATQFQTREFYPKKYAEAYVNRLNTMDKEFLSDLATPDLDIDGICDLVFPRHRSSELDSVRINKSSTRSSPENSKQMDSLHSLENKGSVGSNSSKIKTSIQKKISGSSYMHALSQSSSFQGSQSNSFSKLATSIANAFQMRESKVGVASTPGNTSGDSSARPSAGNSSARPSSGQDETPTPARASAPAASPCGSLPNMASGVVPPMPSESLT